jgi:hypothetical protein
VGFALSHADRRAIGPTEGTSLSVALRNCFVNARKQKFVIVSEYIVVLLTGSSKSKCSQSVRLRCLYPVCPLEVAKSHFLNTWLRTCKNENYCSKLVQYIAASGVTV